jgi:hypothetical protein
MLALLVSSALALHAPARALPGQMVPTRPHPRMASDNWIYPQKGDAYVELPPAAERRIVSFRPPRTPYWAKDLAGRFDSMGSEVGRRLARAAELAARRRSMPSLRQRDLRNEVVFGLVRYEVEEMVNVATDLFNTSLLIDYASGRLDTTSIECKAAKLYDRHRQRWPLISWLLDFDYDPLLCLLTEEERLQRRGRDLREAVVRLWPAVVAKLKAAVRRDPFLVFPVACRVVASSILISLYQAARSLRPLVSSHRIYALMNAFLMQVARLLHLTQMPDDERLVDFAVLEDAIATALAEPAIRLEVAVRRPQVFGAGVASSMGVPWRPGMMPAWPPRPSFANLPKMPRPLRMPKALPKLPRPLRILRGLRIPRHLLHSFRLGLGSLRYT